MPLFLQESAFFRLILRDSLDGLVFLLSDHGLMNKLEPMLMFYVSIQPCNIDGQGSMTSDPDNRKIFVYNIWFISINTAVSDGATKHWF